MSQNSKVAGEMFSRRSSSRARRWLRRFLYPAWLGTIRRTTPLSNVYGFDRGTPVDRYYIERFLFENRQAIRGRVLEVKDSNYTTRFGMEVVRRDVLDLDRANPVATLIADLANAGSIPSESFDCFILTQTLQFIYDTHAAIEHAHRILAPGGMLLATVPAVSRLSPRHEGMADYWRFTVAACQSLFGPVFGEERVQVKSFGNVLTSIAFLTGMACEELSTQEMDVEDVSFPVIVGIQAVKN